MMDPGGASWPIENWSDDFEMDPDETLAGTPVTPTSFARLSMDSVLVR